MMGKVWAGVLIAAVIGWAVWFTNREIPSATSAGPLPLVRVILPGDTVTVAFPGTDSARAEGWGCDDPAGSTQVCRVMVRSWRRGVPALDTVEVSIRRKAPPLPGT